MNPKHDLPLFFPHRPVSLPVPSHPQTGDGTGRVATLVGGRGGTGPAHFIPLTAKLNSISVLGSGPRASRPAVSVAAPRSSVGGRRNSGSGGVSIGGVVVCVSC